MNNEWAHKPLIYEINTRVWLTELSNKYGYHINLYNVPDEVLDDLATYQFDAIWLMGIWTRGAATWRSALNYLHEYRPVLPDLTQNDVAGSGYAIHGYYVEPIIGGRDGLASLRTRLRARNMKLILDYVPNHVATDHPWTRSNPDYFVHRTVKATRRYPGMFFAAEDATRRKYAIAHGRDPYFPGWIDTAQLNAFDPGLRRATIDTLLDIASQCDGVRCDMAMLMLNSVFNQTWGGFIDDPTPEVDFWDEVIPAVRQLHPNFLMMAEVYWGLEYTLQQQGFDYTYDKTLYDRLFADDMGKMRAHLEAHLAFQERNIRFIENHDEHRAAAAFGIPKSKVGATLICTLPGAVLLHDGQFEGRTVKLPVHLARQPEETPNLELQQFYRALLVETRQPIYQNGTWRLLETEAWRLLAYSWLDGDAYRLIVVNLSGRQMQDVIKLRDKHLPGTLVDVLNGGEALHLDGTTLNVTLEPYEARIFGKEHVVEIRMIDMQRA